MTEYKRERQENERRINVLRISRALYEYISGEYASADRPTVQRLAQMLHYEPGQLCKDIKDAYKLNSSAFCDSNLLGKITARYNAEVDATRRAGELDFIPEETSAGEMLRIIIAEYALRNYPDLMQDE